VRTAPKSEKWPVWIRYCLHAGLASVGVTALSFGLEDLIRRLDPGLPFDSLEAAFWGPTFAVPVAIGMVLGACFGSRLPRLAARLLFVLPLLLAIEAIMSLLRDAHLYESTLSFLQRTFLAQYCGSFLCTLRQASVTAPLLSTIAYSIGSEIASPGRSKKMHQPQTLIPSKH
jgi:hypothetical protein